jgi:UDP-N-acetylglucosamine:LPS N-acetylglucosamine transferase
LQKKNYRYINRFNECWVPDNEKENILAGELSHPEKMPLIKTVYIGPLSRFEKREEEKIYNLLIILSGPEPQRSILEKIILHQAVNSKKNILLVKGRPDEKQTATQRNNLTIVNHLSSTELNKALQQSKMVICRSGYSSIMDLYAIKQNAILIPTPGQTEQEYLAKWLMNKRLFYSVPQKNFEMKKAIREALLFYGEN